MVTPASSFQGKRGNASTHFFLFCGSQPPPLRGTSFQRKEGDTRMPPSPWCHFERTREIFFVCGQEKRCEERGHGKHCTPKQLGITVLHADSFTKENENGKRKRSLGCARDDETRKCLYPFLFILRQPTSAPFGASPSRGRREIRECRPRAVPDPFGPDDPLS